jgi:cysteinyl-tRNA synthetase
MDDYQRRELEQAQEYLNNLEGAFDKILRDYGDGAARCEQALQRGQSLASIPAEDRESAAKLAAAKAFINDANRQLATVEGNHEAAKMYADGCERLIQYRDRLRQARS